VQFYRESRRQNGIEDARWYDKGSKCGDQKIDYYLKMLNNKLIIDRIVSLDMTNIQLTYNPVCRSVGKLQNADRSTTWVLIPPVMSLIKPKPEECAKVLEFLELVADAVTNVSRYKNNKTIRKTAKQCFFRSAFR
jgi:hypothetical protein